MFGVVREYLLRGRPLEDALPHFQLAAQLAMPGVALGAELLLLDALEHAIRCGKGGQVHAGQAGTRDRTFGYMPDVIALLKQTPFYWDTVVAVR